VFHVSQLKPCSDSSATPLDLPIDVEGDLPLIQPLAVLDWKQKSTTSPVKVLIQWEGLFPEDATWEAYDDICATYPEFNLEDKVCLDDPGDVMSSEEEIATPKLRPKRQTKQPKRLDDCVLGESKRRGKK
jgi:hypothetical protein